MQKSKIGNYHLLKIKDVSIMVIFLFLSITLNIIGQTCNVQDSIEWEKVKIVYKCPIEIPDKYHIIGEAEIKIRKPINEVEDLSTLEKEKIKKMAAESNSCISFICYDTKHKSTLYCCWIEDTVETDIIDTISRLPEVIKLTEQIDSLSQNKHHISIFINSRPNETEKYYWIKVAEDNGYNLVSYYNFFVFLHPLDLEIKYFDTINDKIISIETWRKLREE